VLLEILSHVDATELIWRVASVSKRFYFLANHQLVWKKKLILVQNSNMLFLGPNALQLDWKRLYFDLTSCYFVDSSFKGDVPNDDKKSFQRTTNSCEHSGWGAAATNIFPLKASDGDGLDGDGKMQSRGDSSTIYNVIALTLKVNVGLSAADKTYSCVGVVAGDYPIKDYGDVLPRGRYTLANEGSVRNDEQWLTANEHYGRNDIVTILFDTTTRLLTFLINGQRVSFRERGNKNALHVVFKDDSVGFRFIVGLSRVGSNASIEQFRRFSGTLESVGNMLATVLAPSPSAIS